MEVAMARTLLAVPGKIGAALTGSWVAILVIVAACSTASAQSVAIQAITHVSVVDVTTGELLDDRSVIIEGNRIAAVGPAATMRVPPGARIVDGRGKFLIPGLWDMHSHVFENSSRHGADNEALSFPLYIANGVTGVRDMWTTREGLARVRGWNDAERAGSLVGPRVVPTSTMLSGPAPGERNTIVVTTPEQAARVVDSLLAGGVRTIKVQNALARDVYFAIATRTVGRGADFVGHVTAAVTVREASDAGQRSIEHMSGVPDGCSSQEAEIMRRRSQGARGLGRLIAETYDDSTCRALARSLASRGTWLVPTSVVKTIGLPDDSLRTGHRGYSYTPADRRAEWALRPLPDSATQVLSRGNFTRGLAIVGLMSRNGVPLLAGTDVTNDWLAFGFSLQDELGLMVSAGLSPLEALRTATINPAIFLHATDSLGTVAAAHIADLVLLDGNPLLNIRNTQRISAVFADGRYFDRVALDSLLARAKQVADAFK
jgi:hypothetical protein